MTALNVRIDNRDFTALPIRPFNIKVNKLSWTAYGGADQALVTAHAPLERLLDFVSLLRCPLTVLDPAGDHVWYGYINKIEITFEYVQFFISLEDLYNKVKVLYSYLSPDNIAAELYDTTFKGSPLSQAEYGIKERVLFRDGIDDAFALALRDTFLEVSAFPRTLLKPSEDLEVSTVRLYGLGWFHTLDWRFYENKEGYYANHGPGPGQQSFGDGTVSAVAQRFQVNQNVGALHAYYMLRKNGSPTANIQARLYNNSTNVPSTTIATTAAVAGSGLSTVYHEWIKFSFSTPQALTAGNQYWIGLITSAASASHFYYAKTDENMSFSQRFVGRRFTSSWVVLVPLVMTNALPHFYFRLICANDSGALIKEMVDATGEFFSGVQSLISGVVTTPYKDNNLTTLQEVRTLMKLGTANHRPILATVDPYRRLTFYEQPDPNLPTATLDPSGRFYSQGRHMLPAYRPPIGQFAMLTGVDRFTAPFDLKRTPAYFVDSYVYRPCLPSKH